MKKNQVKHVEQAHEAENMESYVTYTPLPAELAAVGWMQRNGAPMNVQYIALMGIYPTGSYINHVMRFTLNGKSEMVDARLTVSWPWVSLNDLENAGLVVKPPPIT